MALVNGNIRAELARAGKTVKDAQGVAGIAPSTWDARMADPGSWRVDQLVKLAAWLNVELVELVCGT